MNKRGLLDLVINRIPCLKAREKCDLGEKFDREEDFYRLSKGDVERLVDRPLKGPWTMDAFRAHAEKDAATALLREIGYVCHGEAGYPPCSGSCSIPRRYFFTGEPCLIRSVP